MKTEELLKRVELVLQGIVRNITKQKKLEKTLQESEERAAALLRAIPDLMFRTDRDGVYLDYKAALEDLVSEESADRIGKRRRDVLPPEAAEKIDWYTRETLDTGQMQQFEYRLKIPGKGWRVAEARMVPSGENEVISIVRDVTEQKEQQRALKESEKRYRMIAENTGDVICLLSKDFRPVYISPSSEAVFGYSEDDFAEKDLLFMVHPEDKPFLLAEIENGLVENGRKEWRASFRIKKKSGELCWVEAVANWIMDESGALKNILTVHRDITAQKNLEFQLQFLMRELNHRVKNNLYLVSSLIRLKNESLGDKVDLSDLSNQVFAIQEAHRLLQESENLTTVSLRRYVESLLSATLPQWHGRPVGIEKNIEDLEIPSRTATSIGIIISELSINAMKHGFGEAERPRIKVSIEKTADDEELMLIFSNSGRPFPKELDIENTPSLGFRLINASVQQLKGSLELERAPEPVFTIRFPVQGEVN